MEKDIITLFQLLSQIHKNTQIQNTLRIPIQSLKILFSSVDSRNKGYLDLADVYQITGDVSQDQLFIAFKHLDRSRKGRIQLQDLLSSMGKQNQSGYNYDRDSFGQSLKKARQYFNVFYQNTNALNNFKISIGITREFLFDLYRKISLLVKAIPGKLPKNDLCQFLKDRLKFHPNLINQLDALINSSIIREQEFISSLMPMNYIPINSIDINSQSYQRKQDFLPSNHCQVKQNLERVEIRQDKKNQFKSNYKEPFLYHLESEQKKILQPRYLNSYKQKQQKHGLFTKSTQKYNNQLYNHKDFKSTIDQQDQYQKKLYQIQKRRQELRRGSQDRKKLIDELMKRKKNNLPYETFQLDYLQNYKIQNQSNNTNYMKRTNSNNIQTIKSTYITQMPINHYKLSIQNFNQIKKERQPLYRNDMQYFKNSYLEKSNNNCTMNYSNSSMSISKFMRPASSLQKQNIFKRAQEEAGRKIQQIERKARMKVLQKKSTAGFRWLK